MTEDGNLQFLPVAELNAIRMNPKQEAYFCVTEEEKELTAGDGVCFEMKFKVDLEQTDADRMELILRCGEGKKTVCLFDFKRAELCVDRNESDGWSRGVSRSVMYLKGKKELDVHILSDQSSLEIFTDRYQNNHSNNIFAADVQNQMKIRAYGGKAIIREYEAWGLKECFS